MEALTAGGWATLIAFLGVCSLTFLMGVRNWVRLSGERTPRRHTPQQHTEM